MAVNSAPIVIISTPPPSIPFQLGHVFIVRAKNQISNVLSGLIGGLIGVLKHPFPCIEAPRGVVFPAMVL